MNQTTTLPPPDFSPKIFTSNDAMDDFDSRLDRILDKWFDRILERTEKRLAAPTPTTCSTDGRGFDTDGDGSVGVVPELVAPVVRDAGHGVVTIDTTGLAAPTPVTCSTDCSNQVTTAPSLTSPLTAPSLLPAAAPALVNPKTMQQGQVPRPLPWPFFKEATDQRTEFAKTLRDMKAHLDDLTASTPFEPAATQAAPTVLGTDNEATTDMAKQQTDSEEDDNSVLHKDITSVQLASAVCEFPSLCAWQFLPFKLPKIAAVLVCPPLLQWDEKAVWPPPVYLNVLALNLQVYVQKNKCKLLVMSGCFLFAQNNNSRGHEYFPVLGYWMLEAVFFSWRRTIDSTSFNIVHQAEGMILEDWWPPDCQQRMRSKLQEYLPPIQLQALMVALTELQPRPSWKFQLIVFLILRCLGGFLTGAATFSGLKSTKLAYWESLLSTFPVIPQGGYFYTSSAVQALTLQVIVFHGEANIFTHQDKFCSTVPTSVFDIGSLEFIEDHFLVIHEHIRKLASRLCLEKLWSSINLVRKNQEQRKLYEHHVLECAAVCSIPRRDKLQGTNHIMSMSVRWKFLSQEEITGSGRFVRGCSSEKYIDFWVLLANFTAPHIHSLQFWCSAKSLPPTAQILNELQVLGCASPVASDFIQSVSSCYCLFLAASDFYVSDPSQVTFSASAGALISPLAQQLHKSFGVESVFELFVHILQQACCSTLNHVHHKLDNSIPWLVEQLLFPEPDADTCIHEHIQAAIDDTQVSYCSSGACSCDLPNGWVVVWDPGIWTLLGPPNGNYKHVEAKGGRTVSSTQFQCETAWPTTTPASCGILCSHALRVFIIEGLRFLPQACVLKCWSKHAKGTVPLDNYIDLRGYCEDPSTSRYNDLCYDAINCAKESSTSTEACTLFLDKGCLKCPMVHSKINSKMLQPLGIQCAQPTDYFEVGSVPAYLKLNEVYAAVVYMFEQRTTQSWVLLPLHVCFGMGMSWDPGGPALLLLLEFTRRAVFQGGRCAVILVTGYLVHASYIHFIDCRDSNGLKVLPVLWDPGGLSLSSLLRRRLGDKPCFKEGGVLATSHYKAQRQHVTTKAQPTSAPSSMRPTYMAGGGNEGGIRAWITNLNGGGFLLPLLALLSISFLLLILAHLCLYPTSVL